MTYELQSSEARNAGERREIDLLEKDLRDAQTVHYRQTEKITELRERA